MSIAIVTDSNSGITQEQAEALQISVLPMPFYIDGELYYEDINLTQKEFYHKLEHDAKITTSMPAIGDVLELWKKQLEEYDEVLYIPMSSGLSSSCSAAQMLADATQYTSVIVAPKLGTLRIQHIQLVPGAAETALMIIVTNLGIVKDAVIRVPDGLDADDLYSISRMLTQRLANKPLEAVRQTFSELLRDTENNRRLMGETLRVIEKKLEAEDSTEVFIGGSSKLLNYPEYSDVQKAKNFLAVLESKDKIRRLIGREGGMEVTIRIGAENDVPEMNDCSIVTAKYKVGDQASGTLGIIGPTRMNYNRVIPVLEFMSRAVSEILSNRKA
jgi:heat-inducible transcriptional repressor